MLERLLGILFPTVVGDAIAGDKGVVFVEGPVSSTTTSSSVVGGSSGRSTSPASTTIDYELQDLHQQFTSGKSLDDAIYALRRRRLIKLMIEMECLSVRAKDMPTLRDTCLEYVKSFQLQKEIDLIHAIHIRFNIEYIPGLSMLGLEKYKRELAINNNNSNNANNNGSNNANNANNNANQTPITKNNNSIPLTPLLHQSSSENLSHYLEAPSPVAIPHKKVATSQEQKYITIGPELYKIIHLCSFGKTYLICSVKRHQSTLWVSYRMFLEGYREFDAHGNLTAVVALETPVMFFGAKKFKSGISPICYIWKSLDSKVWKEKTAIAKIIHQGNRYVGIPIVDESVSIGEGNKSSLDMDASQLQSDLLSPESMDLAEEDIGLKLDNNDSLAMNSANTVIPQDEFNSAEIMKGGPVVVVAECKGMEKMIHANAVYARHSLSPDSDASTALLNWDEETITRYITEIDIMIGEPSKFSLYAPKFHILRNRMPRKVAMSSVASTPKKGTTYNNATPIGSFGSPDRTAFTPSKNTQLALDFGRLSRVTVASRKNLVMEEIFNERGEVMNYEWSQESIHPCFQLGKSKENVFALDFYGMSPFQAFVLAISVFNQ